MDTFLGNKILHIGFQKKKNLEKKYEIKIILPTRLFYEPLNYLKIILNIEKNINKLINGYFYNVKYLIYVNFIKKSNFITNYPNSKYYFNLIQYKQQYTIELENLKYSNLDDNYDDMPPLVEISDKDWKNLSIQSLINKNIHLPIYNEFKIDKSEKDDYQNIDKDEQLRKTVDNLLDDNYKFM